MWDHIIKANFINYIEDGCISIVYRGEGFNGKLTIYINEFFPCTVAKLKMLLKEYREPLEGEYISMCWCLYHWLEDLSKHCGVFGKAYGNKVLKNMDVLAKELNIS